MHDLAAEAKALLESQKLSWPMLRDGCAALDSIQTRTIELDGFAMRVQFNPRRITSSAAKVDDKSIRERKCFLCQMNLPPEQRGVAFEDDYVVLCNPFPIFPEHFTIPHRQHIPQRIYDSFGAMLDLARAMHSRYTIFYNGPKCGASAPDHLHFQAGDKGFMTIESEYDRLKGKPIATSSKVTAYAPKLHRPFGSLESNDRDALINAFHAFYRAFADQIPAEDEPMMNILASYEPRGWRIIIFPRAKHRPSFYFAEGDDKLLLSPASVDLGGVCIVPLEHDYLKLDRAHIELMLREVMLPPDAFQQLSASFAANLH